MKRLGLSLLAGVFLAACSSVGRPSSTSIDGLNVACDAVSPSAPTCAGAVAAALARSSRAQIDSVEYHVGGYCAPGQPCESAAPNAGYLVVHTKVGPTFLIRVFAEADGSVGVLHDWSCPVHDPGTTPIPLAAARGCG